MRVIEAAEMLAALDEEAALAGDDVFVVELATGFYRNPELNLSSSNGY